MPESLFSPSWYRIADMRPRLRSHIQIHRHFYRGRLWYVMQNHATGRFHRFSPEAYLVIGLLDGSRTLGEIWKVASERLGDDMPTQEEVLNLLTQLHRADALQSDSLPIAEELQTRDTRQSRQRRMQAMRSPLAIRIPVLDPERFLAALAPLVTPLFSVPGMVMWLMVVTWALFLAVGHWSELTENVGDRVLAMNNLLLLWLTFPLVKALHELGHGFAVKRWGGEVHEMGIMLLVFMPVPYVDASAASAFREKRQRMLVGAAGMLVEVFIAAVALFVWLEVEPGLVRACAFNIMLIAGVSTVLFNGNPLLRFDGYYILADGLEISNLGTRANQYIGYLIQKYAFGVRNAPSPVSARGERSWFFFYAIASFCYRMLVFAGIIWFIAGEYFIVGVLLAIWAVVVILIAPLARHIWFLLSSPHLSRKRARALGTTGAVVGTVAAALMMIPVHSGAIVEGVIRAPEKSIVRAGAEGFVAGLVASPGEQVDAQDVLVLCEDPELPAEVRVFKAQRDELKARYDAEILQDRARAQITAEQIEHVEGRLARARERQRALTVRSPTAGVFVVSNAADMPGRFVHRGEVLGYVMDFSTVTARIVVPQEDVDLAREQVRRVEVRLADRLAKVFPAVIRRQVPAASDELPSAALSTAGGGSFATRPDAEQPNIALERLFQFDLELPEEARVSIIGERVYVRLLRDPEPLALQWYRRGRQLFLSRFNV